jgi:splicing factor 3B subunit 3
VCTVVARLTADEYDSYIVLSFPNGTLVLSIGETIEEVSDTGFLSSGPTLAVQLLGDSGLLQVHPYGLRHIRAADRVDQWECPPGRTIVAATTNKRQVVIALSTAELIYFELDEEGSLSEFQDKKELPGNATCVSIAEVPEGRKRTPFLVSRLRDRLLMIGRRLRQPDGSDHLSRTRQHSRYA